MAPRGKKKGRTRKKKNKLRTPAFALLVGVGLLLTSLSWFLLSGRSSKHLLREEFSSRAVPPKRQKAQGNHGAQTSQSKAGRAAQTWEGSEGLPKIAIVIDDVGFDVELARSFLALKPPPSLSILPTAPHAQVIAHEALRKGVEVLLLANMGEEEFIETLNGDLSKVPGAKGVNNHMGSLLTEREDKMALLFRELKKRHLFFVDSRTTPHTVAARVAEEMKVPVASRSVFLDNELSEEAMRAQWDRLLVTARQKGYALVIAHPHRETMLFLRGRLPDLRSEARLVRVADIVN
jgi:polysaccharide deacetylase 2 family uncharacterized protein YibQ